MDSLVINKREKTSTHSVRKIRRQGKIPGVIYGALMNNFLFEVSELELNKEIKNNGEFGIINISLDGEEHKALIKEIQRDPSNNKLLHIDLEDIDKNKNIETEIPIRFLNEGYIQKYGGVIQKEKSYVKIKCNANDIPECIDVDFNRDDIGTAIKISDVEIGAEISILDSLDSTIASISYVSKNSIDDEDKEKK